MDSLRKQSRMLYELELHHWAQKHGKRLPPRKGLRDRAC